MHRFFKLQGKKIRRRIAVLAFFLLGYLVYKYAWREYVIKYPEQCTAYPNDQIRTMSENNYSFDQIEEDLNRFGIMDGGLYVSKNKSINFNNKKTVYQ